MGSLFKRMVMAGVFGCAAVMLAASTSKAEPLPIRSNFEVSLYGYVKLDASYDTQRTAAGNLMFFVLPENADGKQDEFNMTARETRLGLNIRVPEIEGMQVSGRFESDFYSGTSENSPNLRLRLAYVDLERGSWSLRAGQDWETFINAIPKIVNFSYLADAGALGLRRPQVRVTNIAPLGDNTRLVTRLAAARTIGQDIDGGGQDDGAAAGYPSGQLSVALETQGMAKRRTMIAFSGHAGNEKADAFTAANGDDEPVVMAEKDYESWSLIGSVMLPLSERLMVQGAIWKGKNLDNYFGAIGQGINAADQKGIVAKGGWAQLVVDVTKKLNINLGYGLDDPEDDTLSAGNRSKNELYFANAFYHLNKATVLAAEYSNLTTSYLGGDDAENDRVQASVIFRF